jgi:hypothetical protein
LLWVVSCRQSNCSHHKETMTRPEIILSPY